MTAPFAAAATALAASSLGVAATYTPSGGSAVTIRVVPRTPEGTFGGFPGPTSQGVAAMVMVPEAALSARPTRGDAITLDGTAYAVAEVLQDARAASWTLHLRKA
jgi:hypothetical protein